MGPRVLIAVVKSRSDLRLALRERWYRIPQARAPKRSFRYVAFYQPAPFGREAGRIRWYARVRSRTIALRRELLPREPDHPWAGRPYVVLRLGPAFELPLGVRNTGPRRVTFCFTTLGQLFRSRDILELFEVAPIESILARSLKRAGLNPVPQHTVADGRRRVRVDLALFCRSGPVAVECDGDDHRARAQRRRDRLKDAFLGRKGWQVLRFTAREILSDSRACARRVCAAARKRNRIAVRDTYRRFRTHLQHSAPVGRRRV